MQIDETFEKITYLQAVFPERFYTSAFIAITIMFFLLRYVVFPILDRYSDKVDKHLPDISIVIMVLIVLYGEQYELIAMLIIWTAFLILVVNSNKYPRINRFFDSIF